MLKQILGALTLLMVFMPALAAPQLVIPFATPAAAPRHKAWSESIPVKFNREAMFDLAPGAEVELALPNGMRQTYAFDESIDYGGGIRSWVGRSTKVGNGERAIITEGPGAVWGWMHTPWGEYRIYPGKDNEWLALKPATADVPTIPGGDAIAVGDDPPRVAPLKGVPTLAPPLVQQKAAMGSKATPSPVFTLDLMILYTKDLAEKLGPAIMPMLYNFVTASNKTFADSEVALNVRLVYTARIDLPNSVGSGFALEGMAGNLSEAATFQSLTWGVNSLRDQVGADVVALARDNPAESSMVAGIARILRNPTLYPAASVAQSDAYSVLTTCSIGCEGVFVHEVGHNLGLMHDRATVARDFGSPIPTNIGVFPYAFGHYQCQNGLTCNPLVAGGCVNQVPACANPQPNDFGTVMSYVGPRAFRYSNPFIRCLPPGGTAPGGFCGVADVDDNVRAMNETRQNASAYRNAIPALASLPGSIQFTKAVYAGTESGGSLTFTASRVGGSNGAISASFLTGNGTATAGSDYSTLSGTLSWANGDTTDKTITVAVTNDLIAEGIESITATLSNPAGAFGVHLGHPTTVVGLILEPWPPAGFPPIGYASLATPSAPWAVALDSFDPAGGDSTSFKSGALPPGATGVSSTVFTGTFVSGTVSFAYRVSSYPYAPAFEFHIDGQVAFAEAGDTGVWQSRAFPITAGAHTLEWRYRKFLDFPCASAGLPDGSTNPNCQDRAWIDTVSLPIVPLPKVALSVTRTGTGTGTVASSPSGISCGATCSGNFDSGSFVKLAPTPAPGSVFTGWSGGGACSGTGPCYVAAAATTGVTATFDLPSSAAPRLGNISTRMQVLTGNDVMIGGFVIGGATPKNVVVRARGPSLIPFGITNALANPTLQLFSGQTVIASNDNWQTSANAAQVTASGFAPSDALESAILITLNAGAYTAIVSGAGNTTGVGIVEVFEVDRPEIPLANISTRGQVLTSNDVMIGGFVIQGSAPQTVVVRARGPSLVPFGITNALANPVLQLFSGSTLVASNDDWGSAANAAAITASGFAPGNALESAILITLQPGAYTAIVTGSGGGTGVGIVEVFAQ